MCIVPVIPLEKLLPTLGTSFEIYNQSYIQRPDPHFITSNSWSSETIAGAMAVLLVDVVRCIVDASTTLNPKSKAHATEILRRNVRNTFRIWTLVLCVLIIYRCHGNAICDNVSRQRVPFHHSLVLARPPPGSDVLEDLFCNRMGVVCAGPYHRRNARERSFVFPLRAAWSSCCIKAFKRNALSAYRDASPEVFRWLCGRQ